MPLRATSHLPPEPFPGVFRMSEYLVIELLVLGIAILLWFENRRAPRPPAAPPPPPAADPPPGDP